MKEPQDKKQAKIAEILVWISIFLYFIFFNYISFLKYFNFGFKKMDLAAYSQIMWNIVHGSCFSSILGVNFLAHHAHYILFIIAPIYFIFKSPLTLLFLQTFALAVSAWPLFLLAREEVNEKIGLCLVWIYLLYPALGYINVFEFHVPVFATAFLSFMIYFFKKGDFKKFVLFLIFALLCQENIPLVLFPFGIYAFFEKRDKKWGAVTVLFSSLWFFIIVGKLMPSLNRDTIRFIAIYKHLGNTWQEILIKTLTNPALMLRIIFTELNLQYLNQLFAPLAFFSLLNPLILVIIPSIMQHLLSLRIVEHTIYYHYTAEMIPFIFVSAIYGIKRFLKIKFIKKEINQTIFAALLLAIAVTSNICFGPHLNLLHNLNTFRKDSWDYQKEKFLLMIPQKASVVATFEFLPRLSQRKSVYSFHHVLFGFYTLSRKAYHLPDDVQYALINFNDFFGFDVFYIQGRSEENMRKFFEKGRWKAIEMLQDTILFKRDSQEKEAPYQVLEKMPEIEKAMNVCINNEIELLGFKIKNKMKIQKGEKIEFVFYWRLLKKTNVDYRCLIQIQGRNKKIKYQFTRPICYRIYPTYLWQEGQIIKENYNLFVPDIIQDLKYSVVLMFVDSKNNKIFLPQIILLN